MICDRVTVHAVGQIVRVLSGLGLFDLSARLLRNYANENVDVVVNVSCFFYELSIVI
mgnify:FL=1